MRHRVQGRKLKRTASHRKALLRSLATSLLRHKRIKTTEAKAKETRRFAEAIITRAKNAVIAEQGGSATDVHARRVVARDINDGSVIKELFEEIAPKVANRPGGYTRVVKLSQRLGDGARLAIIELVDYNVERDESAASSRSKKAMSRAERVRRSRAKQNEPGGQTGGKAKGAAAQPTPAASVEEPMVDQSTEDIETPAVESDVVDTDVTGTEETGSETPSADADGENTNS